MRNVMMTAVVATALLAGGIAGGQASPVSLTGQTVLGDKAKAPSPLHLAANVCGSNGCVKVQVARPPKRHGRPPPTMTTPPHTL
jgi:hypothetical protein